ncbi:uncharacterized protein GGS22DRAFT_199042 [Annulohypoxylon maeteangense]|uniref:uncharacterized protein n=1 Tax=Annulohypoxylon maeteangense TaxID=1927788 RepID=UPI002008CFB0|nr:uncharacterized protein GGS22DRAFT_199042 [Annulohypoxylon maeteangense]KAI0886637.1 hypothetical protein GGS22DRAFT_199042 [Annulohypoxylon maeteangense]
MSKAKPENLHEILKYNSFNELPDPNPLPERKIFLHQSKPSYEASSSHDIKANRYEKRLRFEYGCSEAIPAEFDPELLEVDLQARLQLNAENEDLAPVDPEYQSGDDELSELGDNEDYQKCEHIPNLIYTEELNYSFESLSDVSVTESLDSDEYLDEYENNAIINVAIVEKITRVSCQTVVTPTVIRHSVPDVIVRKPAPRIKTGSKPPLSRSAFAHAGLPSPEDGSAAARRYPKAPPYFPYQSKVRRT